MADADKTFALLRRNRTTGYLRWQMTKTVQQAQVVLPQQIAVSTDPALAPLGTEAALYSSEFDTDPNWTWLNQGTTTSVIGLSRVFITPQAGGAATNALRLYGPGNLPPAPWTVRCRFANYSTTAGDGGGLYAYRSSNARIYTPQAYLRVSTSTGTMFSETWAVNDWSNFGTINATRFGASNENERARDRFLQMRCDGTTLYADFSVDNAYYTNYSSTTLATYLGGSGSDLNIGVVANCPNASATAVVSYDFFRVYLDANLNR